MQIKRGEWWACIAHSNPCLKARRCLVIILPFLEYCKRSSTSSKSSACNSQIFTNFVDCKYARLPVQVQRQWPPHTSLPIPWGNLGIVQLAHHIIVSFLACMRTVFSEPSLWSSFVQDHRLLCKMSDYDCCVILQVIGHHMGKPLQIFSQIVVALCIGGTSLAQVQPFASVKLMQLHMLHASFRALLILEKRWSKLFCRSLRALEMCMQLTRPYQRELGAWSGEQCWCFLPLCQVCLLPELSLFMSSMSRYLAELLRRWGDSA